MADEITLRAESGRASGSRESRRIRRTGNVPAIVYGRAIEPIPVSVDHHDLVAALSTEAGTNAIINLEVGGETILTMPKVVERHPFRNLIRHIDFVKVSLTETTQVEVNVNFIGEAEGVKEGGLLSTPRNVVLIEALPTDIPTSIDLDVSELLVGEALRVEDLPEIEGVTYLEDPSYTVVSVTAPAAEVEEEPELLEGEEGELLEGEAAEGEGAEAADEDEGGE